MPPRIRLPTPSLKRLEPEQARAIVDQWPARQPIPEPNDPEEWNDTDTDPDAVLREPCYDDEQYREPHGDEEYDDEDQADGEQGAVDSSPLNPSPSPLSYADDHDPYTTPRILSPNPTTRATQKHTAMTNGRTRPIPRSLRHSVSQSLRR
jgi:hypothetical protein